MLNIPAFRRRIQRDFISMLRDGPTSVDRVDLTDIASHCRRGIVGAAVADLRDDGLIASTETYELSRRPWAHRNPKRKWRLIDEDAAECWLRKHPPLTPEPIRDLFDLVEESGS